MAIVAPIVSTFDNRGIRQAEGAFSRFGRNVGTALRGAATAAAAIGVAVGAASVKAIQAASDLDEAISATNQIFGDASTAVLAFADSAAEAFGQSKQEALDGALVFGTFGKAAGLAGDDLSDFTTGLLGLSSDIASFRNATPEEAIEAIGAALRGESEPLRRFGVLLDDATLKAEALELGIYDGSGALTQQQKILAAEAAIYKQTSDAQGDFQRTSDGLANSGRVLAARMANVQTVIGGALLPVALKLSGFFLDKVVPAVESLANTFAEEGLLGVLRRVWDWFRENAPKVGEWALDLAGSLIGWIAENAGPAIEKLGQWLSAIGSWITDTAYPYLQEKVPVWADALWEWVTTDGVAAIAQLWEWLRAIGRWIADVAFPWLSEKAAIWGEALWNWIKTDGYDALVKLWEWLRAIGRWITDTAWPWITTKTSNWANALFDWIATDATDAISAAGRWLASLGDWFANDAGPLLEKKAAELADWIWAWLESDETTSETKSAAASAVETFAVAFATEFVPGMLKALYGIYQALIDAVGGLFKKLGKEAADDFIGSFTGDAGGLGRLGELAGRVTGQGTIQSLLDRVIPFADGGIVTKPTLGLVGEAGPEAIIPLSQLGRGAGGTTVNVTIQGAVDPVSTARQIRQILEQDQRRLGRLSAV
jgi:hypothetical protein